MGGKGDCYDNAVAESFFSRLKTEKLNGHRIETKAQAKWMIFEFIDAFYNTIRWHSRLDYVSPAQYEAAYRATLAA